MSNGIVLKDVRTSIAADTPDVNYNLGMKAASDTTRGAGAKFACLVVLIEVLMIVLFALFGKYGADADPKLQAADSMANLNNVYPMFQDVHVMIFVGFGFLMTFLRRYGYSAVSVNMLLAAVAVQFAAICNSMFHLDDGKMPFDVNTLLLADFTAAAVLISFGVVLGRTSPLQLLVMTLVECVLYAVNEHIGRSYMHAVDMGDSIFVHAFGAYFGLGVSWVLYRKELNEAEKADSSYNSDIFSMIGTLFLWVFWPSFNSAGAVDDERSRAVLHTYYSIAASCVVSFAVSALVDKRGRISMEHIQNATLAGGVAVGASADFVLNPFGALIIGSVAGLVSTLGFKFITPCLSSRLRLFDTCGVHNLHGIPGILAGLISAIMASLADTDTYGESLHEVFPPMAPTQPANATTNGTATYGQGFSAQRQALAQLAALGITLAIAIGGGLMTGLLLRLPVLNEPRTPEALYEDQVFFNVPDDEDEENQLSKL